MMWIAKLLGVDKWIVGAVAVLALLAAVALGGWWIHSTIYDSGYQAASQKYEAKIAAEHAALAVADANEQRRQTIANNASKQREAEAIAEIERKDAENLQLRRRLASESRQDPDADKPVLGSRSVQRINQIR
ncbi:hypothetical protein ACFYE8_05195 [Rhizobium leguminosarum]|uniref:hypothetical protein n=1 Tax=Rhizobium leguminosarum TaxID=384 RepID=UPI0036D77E75